MFTLRISRAGRSQTRYGSQVRLEGESRSEFVLFVDDGDCFVFVRLAVTVDADSDRSLFVLDDQIDPFTCSIKIR